MDNSNLNQLFLEYSAPVIQSLLSDEFLSTFQDCALLIEDRITDTPAWQIALPAIASLAAGGTLETGKAAAAAWYPMYLASDILDSLEDKEFSAEQLIPSPEIATNLATSLIFLSFHNLTSIQDPRKARRTALIFSGSGFEATFGQHRDLSKAPSSVEKSLGDYWEMIILKSGSVFRMATAGGAAAGTGDEEIIGALGDYGTALGVMLQLIDDCRDAFSQSQETIHWEISLPLLLYLMSSGEENIIFPKVNSRAEWSNLLSETGVLNTISALLLEWKMRSLNSLEPLSLSNEKLILEKTVSLFLERLPIHYQ